MLYTRFVNSLELYVPAVKTATLARVLADANVAANGRKIHRNSH